jgi:hypothetical protein
MTGALHPGPLFISRIWCLGTGAYLPFVFIDLAPGKINNSRYFYKNLRAVHKIPKPILL